MSADTPTFSFARMLAQIVQGQAGLLVIDTNDDAHVRSLGDAFCTARWDHLPGSNECDPLTFSSMQIALRSLLPPANPEEPTGLGAVVEDDHRGAAGYARTRAVSRGSVAPVATCCGVAGLSFASCGSSARGSAS